MKPITMTVYMLIDETQENPHKWDVAAWLDTPDVVGWTIEDGHPEGCPGCSAPANPMNEDECPDTKLFDLGLDLG